MKEDFYRLFEERHRGARNLILQRLKTYLPLVLSAAELQSNIRVVDLGCGRGEWLELLQEYGISGLGIDLDQQMLEACRHLGLLTEQADLLTWLDCQPDASWDFISAFQVVEHLPFADLDKLVAQALRILRPGGLLVMETPNPENLVIGSHHFYLDYTHQRPLPPGLLSFLTEYHGFFRIKILRLNEKLQLSKNTLITLLDVLEGVSPDYAVVAQKQADASILLSFNSFFEKEYGYNLEKLAAIYQDQQMRQWQEIKETSRVAQMQLQEIYSSHSWRWTAPLRWFSEMIRLLVRGGKAWITFAPNSRPHRLTVALCRTLVRRIARHQRIQRCLSICLRRFPWIRKKLKSFIRTNLYTDLAHHVPGPVYLSQRERHLYNLLKQGKNTDA